MRQYKSKARVSQHISFNEYVFVWTYANTVAHAFYWLFQQSEEELPLIYEATALCPGMFIPGRILTPLAGLITDVKNIRPYICHSVNWEININPFIMCRVFISLPETGKLFEFVYTIKYQCFFFT